jgi:hypothetical protein
MAPRSIGRRSIGRRSAGRQVHVAPASTAEVPVERRFMTRRPASGGKPTAWQRRTYAFGRYAVLAIPVFALIAGLLPRSGAAFSLDPAVYAHYAATGRWHVREASVTIALAVTGLIAIVGLAALLWRGRATRLAIAGLILGVAGSVMMIWIVGSTVIRADRLRRAFLDGDWSHLAFNARETGSAATVLVACGAVLLTAGWVVLGVGIMRTAGLNRADGPLVIIGAPLVFIGGMIAHVLPTMGSFLLLAAGLGIVFTADRVAVGGDLTPWQLRRAPASRAARALAMPADLAPGLAGDLGLARPGVVVADGSIGAVVAEATTPPVFAPTSAPAAASAEVADGHVGNGHVADGGDAGSGHVGSGHVGNGHAGNGHVGNGHVDGKPGERGADDRGDERKKEHERTAGARHDAPPDAVDRAGRPPSTGKSVRDFLRGARGAAASWPVSRSRTNARQPGSDGARTNGPARHEPATNATGSDAAASGRPVIGKRFARAIGNAGRTGRTPPVRASGRNSGPTSKSGQRAAAVAAGSKPPGDIATRPTSPAAPTAAPANGPDADGKDLRGIDAQKRGATGPATDGRATDPAATDGPATDGPATDRAATDGPATDGPNPDGGSKQRPDDSG